MGSSGRNDIVLEGAASSVLHRMHRNVLNYSLILGMLSFRAGCQVVMAAAAPINEQEVQEVQDDSDEDQVDQHEEDLVRNV